MPEGRRRLGAWLRHNFPPLNLEAVCLVACYSYDGGPHCGADVRRPSGIERRNRVPGARAERAPELCGGKFEGNVIGPNIKQKRKQEKGDVDKEARERKKSDRLSG